MRKLYALIGWALALAIFTGCAPTPVLDDTQPTHTQSTTQPTAPVTQPTESTGSTEATQPAPGEPVRLVCQGELRTEPSGAAVKTLPKGTQVERLQVLEEWAIVRYEDGLWYLPADILRGIGEYLIVIDPGHQGKANYGKEPIGPGATELKSKVSAGTQGVVTGVPEYEVTLQVSLALRTELENRGYQVVLTRESHDVDISNAQRAQVANELYADAFLRIHINGAEDPSVNGIVTICQTEDNPYNGELYQQSRALSDLLLSHMAQSTGAKPLYVWETDTMSGVNWCAVPVSIVEMGFMSNPEEDRLLVTEAYQQKLIEGMANALDRYFTP